MPTVALSPDPILQFLSNDGKPLIGGKLFTYLAGTTTPYATYTDSSGSIANTNPIILNSRGEVATITGQSCGLWTESAVAYKYALFDAFDNPIWTEDNIVDAQLSQVIIGGYLWPREQAEINGGIIPANLGYEYSDLRRYGIMPNDQTLAAANTLYAQNLWNPALTGPVGDFYFFNTTGADTYYFSDILGIRDGVSIDLRDCTINFAKPAPDVAATDAGFFFAIRDFSLCNGSIVVDYPSAGPNQGHAIMIGARGDQLGPYFSNSYDSLMPVPQGNVHLSRLRVSSNNPLAIAISSTGGLQNFTVDDVFVNGQGVNPGGFYYEFGWATSGTENLRQTSQGHNIHVRNFIGTNFNVSSGTSSCGVAANGAYNFLGENIYISGASNAVEFGPGESLYYRPWVGVDTAGAKHTITLRNVVGQDLVGSGMVFSGAALASGGYLGSLIAALGHPGDYIAETNLLDYDVDGFSLKQASATPAGGYGMQLNGGRGSIRNGTISGGFQRGVVTTDEVVNFVMEQVNIFGCTQNAVIMGIGVAIWSPPRTKQGVIRNCYFAGNGTQSAGVYYAITVSLCDSFLIEQCRSGNEVSFSGVAETTQGGLIFISPNGTPNCTNVVLRENHVGGLAGAAVAYNNHFDQGYTRNHLIEKPTGITTVDGGFDGVIYSITPSLTCASVGDLAITYVVQSLDFIKHDGMVDYTFEITTSAFTHTTSTGNVLITGLPIQANNNVVGSLPIGTLNFQGITKASYTQFVPIGSGGSTQLTIGCSGSGQTNATLAIGDLPTGGTVKLYGSGSYFV